MSTREQILQVVFDDLRIHGYQGLRPDKVVAEKLQLTKGSLYYHFKQGKLQIGHAVVDEILYPRYTAPWRGLATYEGHPIDYLQEVLQHLRQHFTDQHLYGCPLNNLIQEMSPLEEGFRLRLQRITDEIEAQIEVGIMRGLAQGQIRPGTDPKAVGQFVLAAIEGAYTVAKVAREREAFVRCMAQLRGYLEGLRP
jgi:TetR/AcrR family transcriptional regulator, transcriptional repressor for nem operon